MFRCLVPVWTGLKFGEVPVIPVEYGPNGLRTENFLDHVEKFEKLPQVKNAGGFMK